jgi:hypothetical protein
MLDELSKSLRSKVYGFAIQVGIVHTLGCVQNFGGCEWDKPA